MIRTMLRVTCVALCAVVFAACGGGSDTSSGEGQDSENASQQQDSAGASSDAAAAVAIFLDAFRDFKCSSGWANRNGALGRTAYSGSGTCSASFPGGPGKYKVTLQAQAEFDGSSPYRVSINGKTIKQGNIPYSEGRLICDCPDPWRENCPDRVVTIDAGVHEVNKGDDIGYFGSDTYPCGGDSPHGAYAKWRGIDFTPVN